MQLHFLQERKEALEEARKTGWWDTFNFFYALLFLANTIINCIVSYMEHGGQFRISDNTLLFGFHVDPFIVDQLIVMLTILVICAQGRVQGITGWEPITSIPSWMILVYGIIIGLALFSLQGGQYAVLGYMLLSLWFFFIADSLRRRRKREKARAQKALQAKSQVQVNVEPIKMQKCEVCHQESQYDLCLACYEKYRGERHRVNAQLLRAKKAGVPATLTLAQWIETLENFHYHCAYCHGPYECLEHYIPIVEGGGTTFDNCIPSCISCNSSKGDKHPEK